MEPHRICVSSASSLIFVADRVGGVKRSIVLITISLLVGLSTCRDFTNLAEFSVTFQKGANGYTGTWDTHIIEWAGPPPPSKRDNNAGTNDRLAVANHTGVPGHERAILIRFDLPSIPSTAEVTEAYLSMIFIATENGNTVSKTVDVFRITGFWDEGTGTTLDGQVVPPESGVTWNAQPSWDLEALDSEVIGTVFDVWYSFDITLAARRWVEDPGSNYGVLLIQNGTSPADGTKLFAASEYVDIPYRPKLTVKYID